MTAESTVLFRHRTYVDSATGTLIGARRAVGRTTGNVYIELHIQSEMGETLAVNMPEAFNPPVDLIVGHNYKIEWVETPEGKRLIMEALDSE